MGFEICKLEYPDKIRKRFLAEVQYILGRLVRSKIYQGNMQILVDEAGKRLYFTCNDRYEKDRNITAKIKESYSYKAGMLDEIFEMEPGLRLANFLNIPSLQLAPKLMSCFALLRKQLLFLAAHHLFIFKVGKRCFQRLGVGFDDPQTTVIARNVLVDLMSPSLIFIEDRTTIGARSILQTHGMKSDKGFGSCYTIGPIYMMEGADIGSDCILLPGTIVGKGCALYPMTVVKKDICSVYIQDRFYSVTYNQNEEYPYRLNISLAESKSFGIPYPIYYKILNGEITIKDQDIC